MRLPRGATGFRGHGDEPLAATDRAAFLRTCHEIARRTGARVTAVATDPMAVFEAVALTRHAETHVVLRHHHLPLLAFTAAPPAPGPPVPAPPVTGFVEPPSWASDFAPLGLRSLTVDELATPLGRVDLGALSDAEAAQIRYWRPGVLSELLFNSWD
ncbi:hypothetical protein ACIQUQ_09300 [Streptomyces sp. NPDC101118]|uniref:hypothetical protein n=1 Tax=Streptomyces sp. NPDC101118 TaxID=3366109 RepID=UPI0038106324